MELDTPPDTGLNKIPVASRLFDLLPKAGLLGKMRSLLVTILRVGGITQALRLGVRVVRTTGVKTFLGLLRNASNMNAQGVPISYETWARKFLDLSNSDIQDFKNRLAKMSKMPKISILLPTYNSNPEFLNLAITSVTNQLYQNWELCIADDFSPNEDCRIAIREAAAKDPRIKFVFRTENGQISQATNSCLSIATGEYITFLDHDDELTIDALGAMAIYAVAHPDVVFFYSDEDKIDSSGKRTSPHFKPDLNRTLALSMNYFSHLSMYKTTSVIELGGLRSEFDGAQDYDLALRMLEALDDKQIMHVPHVLYHWRTLPQSTSFDIEAKPYALAATRNALSNHLLRIGLVADVSENAHLPNLNDVSPAISGQPLISIVIPTRDQAKILSTCVTSILNKTTYPAFEIIIVNNGSIEEETGKYFESLIDPRIRVIDYPEPFNYSAINNFAVSRTNGDYICLLNNDIEVLAEDWLERMLGFAQLPTTGAVGAKLFYPNGQIQHAGVVLGLGGISGVAGHAHKYFNAEASGYMGRALVSQEFSAVTAACLLISKAKYLEVGGLTEELVVAFNDVDFCLKLLQAGYKNIFTPNAQLVHHESLSRGVDSSKSQIWRASQESLYMLSNWGEIIKNDPSYNRHLTNVYDDFSFAWPPRKSNGVY